MKSLTTKLTSTLIVCLLAPACGRKDGEARRDEPPPPATQEAPSPVASKAPKAETSRIPDKKIVAKPVSPAKPAVPPKKVDEAPVPPAPAPAPVKAPDPFLYASYNDCTNLVVKTDGAQVVKNQLDSTVLATLSKGTRIARTAVRKTAFDTYEVAAGEIKAADVFDQCPTSTGEAYVTRVATTFVDAIAGDSPASSAQTCALAAGTVLRFESHLYDTRVSRTYVKLKLAPALQGCAFQEGYVSLLAADWVALSPDALIPLPEDLKNVPTTPATPATPATPPAPVGPKAPVCTSNGNYIVIDGVNAFYIPNDGTRLEKLVELGDSGFCKTPNRGRARSSYITIGGRDAFYISNDVERLAAFVALFKAGAFDLDSVCGSTGSSITIRGKNALYISNDSERAKALADVSRGGACKADSTCGVDGNDITLGGRDAFYFSSEAERAKGLADLGSAGACVAKAKTRGGVDGNDITVSGKDAFYFSDASARLRAYVKLQEAGAFDPASRCSADGSTIYIGGDHFYISDVEQRVARFASAHAGGLCR